MRLLRVGDKVRVTEGSVAYTGEIDIGDIGTIEKVWCDLFYVRGKGDNARPFEERELELVQSLPAFNVGDSVRVKHGRPGLRDRWNKTGIVTHVLNDLTVDVMFGTDDVELIAIDHLVLADEHVLRVAKEVGEKHSGTLDKLSGAVKYDQGKPRLSLAPREALEGMAEAFGYGAQKYAAHNYRKGMDWTRVLDAGLRHILAELDGEEKDEESGLDHYKHALACIAMYAYFKENNVGNDDRFKPETRELKNG